MYKIYSVSNPEKKIDVGAREVALKKLCKIIERNLYNEWTSNYG